MKFSTIYIKPFFLVLTLIVTAVMAVSGTEAQVESRGGEHTVVYPSWDGIWSTNYGRMELAQDGTEVVGFYTSDEGDGRIFGTAKDYKFKGTWTLVREGFPTQGPIEFTISEDGLSFTGWWAFDTDLKTRNNWSGSKIGERELVEELSDVDYCLWRGAWEFDDGIFIFEQEISETQVTGQLLLNGNVYNLEGTANGWGLDINYENQIDAGSGHLDMDPSLDSFTGWVKNSFTGEHSDLTGTFLSGNLREDFSGTWMTDIGEMEITPVSSSGEINVTIENAVVGQWQGSLRTIRGEVLGPTLSFKWLIRASEILMDGSGELTMSDDGKSFNGRLWGTGGVDFTVKVKGFRK